MPDWFPADLGLTLAMLAGAIVTAALGYYLGKKKSG